MDFRIVCKSCDGSGIYVSENRKCKEVAIVCITCRGRGYTVIKRAEVFSERKVLSGIEKVYDNTAFGIEMPLSGPIKTKGGVKVDTSKAGCTYKEWLNGVTPRPIKELRCPMEHTSTALGSEPIDRCREEGPGLGDRVTECVNYGNKARCWEEYMELRRGIAEMKYQDWR